MRKRSLIATLYVMSFVGVLSADVPRGQQAKVVLDGATIVLNHVSTKTYLHLDTFNYSHPGTSGQQQITVYQTENDNNLWYVRGPRRGGAIMSGDIIRLEHAVTGRYLHSHLNYPAPITNSRQEVTGFGGGQQSDGNDSWRVEVIGSKVWDTRKTVRLIHVVSNVALSSNSKYTHPEAGLRGQQIVTGNSERDSNGLWKAIVKPAFRRNEKISPDLVGRYWFHLVSIDVNETRSAGQDTLYIAFVVSVGDLVLGPITKRWGDRSRGVYLLQNESTIVTEPISTVSDQPVRISYAVVNSGHQENPLEKVHEIGQRLKRFVISRKVGIDLPDTNFANFLVDPQGFLTGRVIRMFAANCDGVVAADQISTTIGEINARLTATDQEGKFLWRGKNYQGTDSPDGCGPNSNYSVSWRVTKGR